MVDEPGVAGSFGSLTYGELEARARGMALALDDLGVGHGERVAIVSPNSAHFLIAYFGVSAYGRVLVPINFRLTTEEMAYIVEHSGASVLLYDPELTDVVAPITVKHRFCLDGIDDAALFAPAPDGAIPADWAADEDATCSVNYTSGTTARPKGVQLTHRNCWLNAGGLRLAHRRSATATCSCTRCPCSTATAGACPTRSPAWAGRTSCCARSTARRSCRGSSATGSPSCAAPPPWWRPSSMRPTARAAEGRAIPGRGTVRIVVAGAPPPSKTIERVETELGWEFIQIYGLTETSPLLTINRAPAEWDDDSPAERSQQLSRAGVPAIGVQIAVDADGEVLARANHVFEGYWEQPEETAAALAGGWFHTGDGGFLDAAYVVIADRKKDVIITGGENVSSIEVEDCLYQHPAVAEVAIIGVPDEKWGETIKALVVCREGSTVTEADLIGHCRDRLAHFKAPTSVEFRDVLDRTATGKLQKYKLRQPYWAGRDKSIN